MFRKIGLIALLVFAFSCSYGCSTIAGFGVDLADMAMGVRRYMGKRTDGEPDPRNEAEKPKTFVTSE